jgi:single-stranded DNA-binding protein
MSSLARLPRTSLQTRLRNAARQLSTANDKFSGTFPSRSVCKAVIVGRTGARPSLFEFDNGGSRLTFNVATDDVRVTDGIRDPNPITQWNRVVVADNIPGFEAILKDLAPGALVYVEGALKIRKESDPDKPFSEFVSVSVTRAHGVFRVLQFGRGSEYGTGQGDDNGLPF